MNQWRTQVRAIGRLPIEPESCFYSLESGQSSNGSIFLCSLSHVTTTNSMTQCWYVRATACKPPPTLLDDARQIGLILICMVEASLECLLATTTSKKSVPISFYRTATESTELHWGRKTLFSNVWISVRTQRVCPWETYHFIHDHLRIVWNSQSLVSRDGWSFSCLAAFFPHAHLGQHN